MDLDLFLFKGKRSSGYTAVCGFDGIANYPSGPEDPRTALLLALPTGAPVGAADSERFAQRGLPHGRHRPAVFGGLLSGFLDACHPLCAERECVLPQQRGFRVVSS